MNFALVDQAHQSKALVDLSQVQYDVLCRVLVSQSDERARLFIEFAAASLLINAVNTGHVD